MVQLVVAAIAVGAFGAVATAADAATFNANGSAKQVYVPGLVGGARTSLLDAKGEDVYTQAADWLGGLLFRLVLPGNGYRVRCSRTAPSPGR